MGPNRVTESMLPGLYADPICTLSVLGVGASGLRHSFAMVGARAAPLGFYCARADGGARYVKQTRYTANMSAAARVTARKIKA
jgi:hypothetical protein